MRFVPVQIDIRWVAAFLLALPMFSRVLPAQLSSAVQSLQPGTETPTWVDLDTGHRVFRLTSEPNSRGLYFNQNAFTPDEKGMIYLTADRSINILDLTSFKSRQLVAGPVDNIVVGQKTAVVYFMRLEDQSLYAVGVDTGQLTKIATLPTNASISTLNADETLAAGTYTEVKVPKLKVDPNLRSTAVRATQMDERLDEKLPMVLFTIDLRSAVVTPILHSTDWLNHVQFSPKDPTLLMYCHEGLWSKVDRIWTVRSDGSHNTLVHVRTMNDEIAGHEFWDADGKTIWYDLQIPRGQNFYLASYNVDTKARRWYSVERDAWSIHYNAASDDSVFAGDGGDYSQVAKSKNGQWIELLSPRKGTSLPGIDQTNLVQSGFFVSQHLVNMSKQNYALEPNVRFSPNHKLVIFTSNMFGPSYVFAVEVAHAKKDAAASSATPSGGQ